MIIPVEYIESGTFCGGEEDCYNAGLKPGDTCYVSRENPTEEIKRLQGCLAQSAAREQAELECRVANQDAVRRLEGDLAAAKAEVGEHRRHVATLMQREAEQKARADLYDAELSLIKADLYREKARADAAVRALTDSCDEQRSVIAREGGCPCPVETERDSLAARVKELEERLVISPFGVDKIDELEQALQFARNDMFVALGLVARIREALGDNGRRMQDELIAYCVELLQDKVRLDRLEEIMRSRIGGGADWRTIAALTHENGNIRAAIDSTRNTSAQ